MKKKDWKGRFTPYRAWREAGHLFRAHRGRLANEGLLMLVNRGSGLVLPASSKYLIDDDRHPRGEPQRGGDARRRLIQLHRHALRRARGAARGGLCLRAIDKGFPK